MSPNRINTISDIIESFDQFGNRTAVCEFLSDGIQTWSYLDLSAEINNVACELLQGNLKPSDRVILWAPNSAMWIAACLGIIRTGAVVIPVDAQLDRDSFVSILRDAVPNLIISSTDRREVMETLKKDHVFDVVYLEELRHHRQANGFVLNLTELQPDQCFCIFYTSGTTGNPKGVPLTHQNVVHQVNFVCDSKLASSCDRLLLPLPLHHIYPFSIGMLASLALGATIVLPRSLTGPQLLRALNEGNASILVGVPRLYSALVAAINTRVNSLPMPQRILVQSARLVANGLLKAGWRHAGRMLLAPIHRQLGSNLRILTSGGAPLESKVAESLQTFGWELAVGYGLTETSPLISLKTPSDLNTNTVGKPLPHVEVKIEPLSEALKSETKSELAGAFNEGSGEIHVRGPNVFAGYRNNPDKNKDVLTSDGWFRTGDLGYIKEGKLYVLGRASSLIVTESGKKIDPEILEAHYAKNKLIQEIGILSRNGRLVAVVVPSMTAVGAQSGDLVRVMHDAIDERCVHLPSYKRLSGYVLSKEPLARTAMSKIRRSCLSEQYDRIRQGLREPAEETIEQELALNDRKLLENARVARVWNYFLTNYPERRLTLDTSPQLDLGIDSLDWLNLTMEIRDFANVEIDQTMLTDIVTMRNLLEKVASATSSSNNNHKTWYESPESFLSGEQKVWLSPLSVSQERLSRWICNAIYLILRTLFKLEVRGGERIPKRGAFLVCPNHASYLDAFVVGSAFSFEKLKSIHFAGWTGIAFANSFTRVLSRLGRVLPVDADHALVSSLAIAAAALRNDKGLVWFPEGRRTLTNELLPFKPGIGLLLEHFDVPVVPVYLSGTADALPPGTWRIKLGQKITVSFGEPVRRSNLLSEGVGSTPHNRIAAGLRHRVQKLRDELEDSKAGTASNKQAVPQN